MQMGNGRISNTWLALRLEFHQDEWVQHSHNMETDPKRLVRGWKHGNERASQTAQPKKICIMKDQSWLIVPAENLHLNETNISRIYDRFLFFFLENADIWNISNVRPTSDVSKSFHFLRSDVNISLENLSTSPDLFSKSAAKPPVFITLTPRSRRVLSSQYFPVKVTSVNLKELRWTEFYLFNFRENVESQPLCRWFVQTSEIIWRPVIH